MTSLKSTITWYDMAVSRISKTDIYLVSSAGAQDEAASRRLLYPRIRVQVLPATANMPPPKTTLAALFMLVGGTTFLLSGIYVYFADMLAGSDRGLGDRKSVV